MMEQIIKQNMFSRTLFNESKLPVYVFRRGKNDHRQREVRG